MRSIPLRHTTTDPTAHHRATTGHTVTDFDDTGTDCGITTGGIDNGDTASTSGASG